MIDHGMHVEYRVCFPSELSPEQQHDVESKLLAKGYKKTSDFDRNADIIKLIMHFKENKYLIISETSKAQISIENLEEECKTIEKILDGYNVYIKYQSTGLIEGV